MCLIVLGCNVNNKKNFSFIAKTSNTGVVQYFDSNKKLIKEIEVNKISDDSFVTNGYSKEFYNNGTRKKLAYFSNGLLISNVYDFYPNGNIAEIIRHQSIKFDSIGNVLNAPPFITLLYMCKGKSVHLGIGVLLVKTLREAISVSIYNPKNEMVFDTSFSKSSQRDDAIENVQFDKMVSTSGKYLYRAQLSLIDSFTNQEIYKTQSQINFDVE
jgi:hypothetical protein